MMTQWGVSESTGMMYPLEAMHANNAEALRQRQIARRQKEMWAVAEADRWRNSPVGLAHRAFVDAMETSSEVDIFDAARALATVGYDHGMDRCVDETTGCHYFHTCEDYY